MKPIHHHALNLALIGVLSAFTTASALAAEAAPSFKVYDNNGDGKVSLDEFKAQGGQEDVFRLVDINGDNSLSGDEFGKASSPDPKAKN